MNAAEQEGRKKKKTPEGSSRKNTRINEKELAYIHQIKERLNQELEKSEIKYAQLYHPYMRKREIPVFKLFLYRLPLYFHVFQDGFCDCGQSSYQNTAVSEYGSVPAETGTGGDPLYERPAEGNAGGSGDSRGGFGGAV